MEIKPTTQITMSVVPDVVFEFCSNYKKYVESFEYYELKDQTNAVMDDKKTCEDNWINCLVANTDDSIIAIIMFGDKFNEAITTQRDYYQVVTKAISRISRNIATHYLGVFAWTLTVVKEEALLQQIDDGVSDIIWEYVDSYRHKIKEKNGKAQTGKKRGRKPKADKAVVGPDPQSEPKQNGSDKVEKEGSESLANDKPKDDAVETPDIQGTKQGRKPKDQQVEETPKKHRGRPRKTAESFVEDEPSTSSDVEEEAAKEAESIPVEGQMDMAEIDFGF